MEINDAELEGAAGGYIATSDGQLFYEPTHLCPAFSSRVSDSRLTKCCCTCKYSTTHEDDPSSVPPMYVRCNHN